MIARVLGLAFVLSACASSPSPSTSTSTATATTTPTSTSTSTSTSSSSSTSDVPEPPRPSGNPNPVVLIGDITAPSEFDVKTLVTASLPKIRECYVAALKVTPALRGKMMVRFVANETGKVTNVDEAASTTNDPGLFECVKGIIVAIAFPKPGGTATVMLPLKFKQ